jgi:2-dehydropantoate 2-reductase
MRVAVFGAGAIGGHLVLRLALGGAAVSVVARGAQLDAIRARGIELRGPEGTLSARVAAAARPDELGPQDAVLVTVKSPSLPEVAAGIAPLLGPTTPVIFVMNGIPWWYFDGAGRALAGQRMESLHPGDALRRAVGLDRTIGGVVYSACEVIEPGVIRSTHSRLKLLLGTPDGRADPAAARVAALLSAGGFPARMVPDIRVEVWRKLLGNLSSGPLCLLTRRDLRTTLADPALHAAALRQREEALACGVALQDAENSVEVVRNLPHKPSVLQDVERGRPTEFATLFRAPLALARLVGVPTPTLDLTIAMAALASGEG